MPAQFRAGPPSPCVSLLFSSACTSSMHSHPTSIKPQKAAAQYQAICPLRRKAPILVALVFYRYAPVCLFWLPRGCLLESEQLRIDVYGSFAGRLENDR